MPPKPQTTLRPLALQCWGVIPGAGPPEQPSGLLCLLLGMPKAWRLALPRPLQYLSHGTLDTAIHRLPPYCTSRLPDSAATALLLAGLRLESCAKHGLNHYSFPSYRPYLTYLILALKEHPPPLTTCPSYPSTLLPRHVVLIIRALSDSSPSASFLSHILPNALVNGSIAIMADHALPTQLPSMVRKPKAVWPGLVKMGMYQKQIAGDGMYCSASTRIKGSTGSDSVQAIVCLHLCLTSSTALRPNMLKSVPTSSNTCVPCGPSSSTMSTKMTCSNDEPFDLPDWPAVKPRKTRLKNT